MSYLSSLRTCAVAAALSVAAARGAAAQQKFQYVGPNECINCHDHQEERQWYEKKEIPEVRRLFPDRSEKAGHINSLKQLDEKKGDEWAAAIGLKDKYDPNGVCVRCHATVFAGDANAGVSCESCHGPASGYLRPHQAKDSYEASVAQFGMTRLIGNLPGWTQQCTNCHVMDDDRLIKAGHPSGDDFDLGQKYLPVSMHFKKKYSQADVSVIAKGEMEGILRRRGRVTPPAIVPPAPPGTPESPIPAPTTPPAVTPGSPPPAPPPAVAPPTVRRAPARRPSDPPPGSPTSIEPPPPLPGDRPLTAPPSAAPSAAPASPAAASPPPIGVPQKSAGDLLLDYWWAVALAIVVLGGAIFWLGRKTAR